MCGITGFTIGGRGGFEPLPVLRQMTDSLIHRGPDDSGCEIIDSSGGHRRVALGHRRLSIIDLSEHGRNPMWSSDKRYVIVFNGEIYNYLELRSELIALGCRFRTATDTEVVLEAFAKWGFDAFARFNGMWALALVDTNTGKLFLSRDRFGKKPLYFARTPSGLVFASEPKALWAHPSVERRPNYEKLTRYISGSYRYVDWDTASFFAEVEQVPKASVVEVRQDLSFKTTSYWQWTPPEQAAQLSELEAIDRYRELFTDAVRLRLRSDVPVGCFLSGGLDSTAVTCVAYKVLGQTIRTFSGVTGETKGIYDESEYIDSVVRQTGARHTYVRPDPRDIVETVDEMLRFHDEPVCTVTWYNLYLIAREIRNQGVPVMLNGHGGDELLAGYWEHFGYFFYDLQSEGLAEERGRQVDLWLRMHDRSVSEIERCSALVADVEAGQRTEAARFASYSNVLSSEARQQLAPPMSLSKPSRSWLIRRLFTDLMHETVPAVLRPEDRNTMAFSIESRSPFLDYRLTEFLLTLPGNFMIRDGVGKWLHREAMRGILPEDVRTRRDKTGFVAPADEWFRTINRKDIESLIESPELRRRGLYDVAELRRLFTEHCDRKANHAMFLWQFLNAELWCRSNSF